MQNQVTKMMVRTRIEREALAERFRNDDGELGSWILIAAFLAMAAAAVGVAISGWIGTQTGNITRTGASNSTGVN